MVIADNLAILVDHVYADWANYSGSILCFQLRCSAIQIYCDFGGYSHIAIGAAKVLNVDLMTNFRQPFLQAVSKSIGADGTSAFLPGSKIMSIFLWGNRCSGYVTILIFS